MKLKEAQMLGILALIAVGIILLCMWGGEEEPEAAGASESAEPVVEDANVDRDLAELYRELLVQEPMTDAAARQPAEEEYVISVGSDEARDTSPVDEEDAIERMIETTAPERIPLTPPETASESGEEKRTEPEPSAPRAVTHIVQKNDTLSSISKKYYGTSGKWRQILEANAQAPRDPRKLMPGTKLRIPSVTIAQGTAGTEAPSPTLNTTTRRREGRTHVVKKDDTLFHIALQYYGDGSQWKRIRSANSRLVSEPEDLKPGMELYIP
jgi:nucleoid-associated protein YgaU